MAEIGRWNGHIFELDSSRVYSFSDLSITASCETEDKESGKQKYASREAANATDISLKIMLSEALGVDVRSEVMSFMEDARSGSKDYFYIGSAKLVPYSLMLTEASASDIDIAAGGSWAYASLQLKMKQAEKDGSTASSGSSSGKSGSGNKNKTNSYTTQYTSPEYAQIVATVKQTAKIVNQAKATSQQLTPYQSPYFTYI